MKTIELVKNATGWNAHFFRCDKPDPEIVKNFGTHILPTSFTAVANAETVLKRIRELNPNATVTIN